MTDDPTKRDREALHSPVGEGHPKTGLTEYEREVLSRDQLELRKIAQDQAEDPYFLVALEVTATMWMRKQSLDRMYQEGDVEGAALHNVLRLFLQRRGVLIR